VLLSGTSTRSAPAGRRPPKPSRQVHTFMKKTIEYPSLRWQKKRLPVGVCFDK